MKTTKIIRYILTDKEVKETRNLLITENDKTYVDIIYRDRKEFTLEEHGNGFIINEVIELDYATAADLYLAMTCMMDAGRSLLDCEISRPIKKIGRRK